MGAPTESASFRSFGELLRRFRRAARLSQEELADRARVSVDAISALERGARRAPQRQTLLLLAAALELQGADRADFERGAARFRKPVPKRAGTVRSVTRTLPVYLTSFVARERELGELKALLSAKRLVTVLGSGGIGKTRLACEAVRAVAEDVDDALFADLASLVEATFLLGHIAALAGANTSDDADPLNALASAIRSRRVLLVLDNCEHLGDAVANAAVAILKACPEVTILATSRERLGVGGESLFRLEPLSVPTDLVFRLSVARSYPALQLFADRATTADARFALHDETVGDVVEICRRLDGIPLAIELAAARLPMLGVTQLRRHLDRQIATPGYNRDAPARHHTMEATIAWSYDLLDEAERTLMERIGIFVGGFTLDAAEIVCTDNRAPPNRVAGMLDALVEKSLVQVHENEIGLRYGLLEPVRLFSLRQLSTNGTLSTLAHRHATWLADVAEIAHEDMVTRSRWDVLLRIRHDLDNIRAALERLSASDHDDGLLYGRIVGGLRWLWVMRGFGGEGTRLAELALDRLDESRDPAVVARVVRLLVQSNTEPAAFDRAREILGRIGDVAAQTGLSLQAAFDSLERADLPRSRATLADAAELLARGGNKERHLEAWFFGLRGRLRAFEGRAGDARSDTEAGIRIAGELGNAEYLSTLMQLRAEIEAFDGNFLDAVHWAERSLIPPALPPARMMDAEGDLATYHLCLGNETDALRFARTALRRALERSADGRSGGTDAAVRVLALIAARRGDAQTAATLNGWSDSVNRKMGRVSTPPVRALGDLVNAALGKMGTELGPFIAAGEQLSAREARELALSVS